jgi:hypothetical protein
MSVSSVGVAVSADSDEEHTVYVVTVDTKVAAEAQSNKRYSEFAALHKVSL